MRHLSLRLLLAASIVVLCGTSFAPKPLTTNTSTTKPFGIMYYWYSVPGDQFLDYADVYTESMQWWIALGGVIVNTNPTGGTNIAKGYLTNNYPHMFFPSQWLYAHYTH